MSGDAPTPGDPGVTTDEPGVGLGRQVGNGVGWSLVNTLVSRFGSFLAGIAVARILVPEDYGVYAVGLVVLTVLLSMNELGVSLAVVRHPGPVEEIAPTVNTLAIGSSLVLFTGSFVAAPLLAGALHAPQATGVVRLLAVGVLVDGLTSVPSALMTRAFLQRRRLVIDLVAFVLATPVVLLLALGGHGAWSLAWGALVGNVVTATMTVAWAPSHHRPGFDPVRARALLAFGTPLAATSLVLLLMLNVDYVVVGRVLGPTELGLYLLAFNLCSWPVVIVSTAVRRVSLAGFSRWAEDGPAAAQAGFSRLCVLTLTPTVPMCLLLAVYGSDLVAFLYGDTWAPAAPVLPFLAALGLARVVVELVYDLAVATGRGRLNLVLHGVWLIALVPALAVGAHLDGIRGVAVGHLVVVVAVVAPLVGVVLRRSGVPLRALAVACAPVGQGALVLVLTAAVVHELLAAGPGRLLVGGLVSGGAFAAVVAARTVRGYRELVAS